MQNTARPFVSADRSSGMVAPNGTMNIPAGQNLSAYYAALLPPLAPHSGGDTNKDLSPDEEEVGTAQPEAIEELSEYQKAIQEASKHMVLPYIPQPDPKLLCSQYVEALENKKIYLTGLANAEQRCHELEKVVQRFLGDAEVKKLTQKHRGIERMDSVKGRYTAAAAGLRWRDFFQSLA
ncbi:hypothetical protein BU15DRAFT_60764 [Melanogaster broomeanus]|nr:hypothetical protein BU15DRAFT_60764 [Melanogaster broomeanus]